MYVRSTGVASCGETQANEIKSAEEYLESLPGTFMFLISRK